MRDLKGRGLLHRQRGGGTRVAQANGNRIAFFAPFAQAASQLGFMDGQIHAHLSDLTAQRGDDLRLQLIGRRGESQLDRMLSGVDELIEKGMNGVFYYPIELSPETMHYNQLVVEKMRSAGVAVVLVDRDIVSFPQRSKFTLVTYDNRRSGYLIADHLIKQGCKRIAFVTTPNVSSAAGDRLRGYIDALEDNDLPVDRSLIRRANLEDLNADFCKSLMGRGKCRRRRLQAGFLRRDGRSAPGRHGFENWPGRAVGRLRRPTHRRDAAGAA